MAAERQSDKMASDMEVQMEQRCVIEYLHAQKMAPTDNHQCLLNIYGDQPVDLSTVRWWVVLFSCADNDGRSSLLVQVFMSVILSLLFIAGEHA